jgi:hypothetical protein
MVLLVLFRHPNNLLRKKMLASNSIFPAILDLPIDADIRSVKGGPFAVVDSVVECPPVYVAPRALLVLARTPNLAFSFLQ